MRIGKFEKWILVNALKKRKGERLTDLTFYNDKPEQLFKGEILSGYFNLKRSDLHSFGDVKLKFKESDEYKKALAQYSRTWQRMAEKGLINHYTGVYSRWSAIKLTDKGINKAEQYLNVNS